MSSKLIKRMLDEWEEEGARVAELVSTEISLDRGDLIKVRALAEAYQLPVEELLASLISTALHEVEEQMPYIAGDKVIRVDEGDPIYEDVGRTPRYLAALAKLGSAPA